MAAILALAVLTGYPAQALAAGDRVSFDGYGVARIGMSRQALESALGNRLSDDDITDDAWACEQVHPESGYTGVSYMLVDGKLARIDIDAEGIQTLSGIGVGASEVSVRATYRGRVTVSPHAYSSPEGSYLTIRSRNSMRGIRFETSDGAVTRYYVGTAQAIQYIEGCL